MRKERTGSRIRKGAKYVAMGMYVFIYAKIRNYLMGIFGGCHICVLAYHRVCDEYKDAVTVGVSQFREQMELIKGTYKIISVEGLSHLKSGLIREPQVLITFDDGYKDNLQAAAILQALSIKAVFFITTRYVGSDKGLAHDMLKIGKAVPMLSWDDVKQMAALGHAIGNHGAEHINLAQLDADQAIQQILTGQKDLVERVGNGASPEMMAYPFGRKEDLPNEIRCRLKDFGIRYCFSAYGGINRRRFDELDIRRQGINYSFDKMALRAAIEGWRTNIPVRKIAKQQTSVNRN